MNQHEDENAPSEDDDDDDDLPDPEALEAKILSQVPPKPSPRSKPSSRKPKRAPSLIFRQSILPSSLPNPPLEGITTEEDQKAIIPLSDGRTIEFNPLDLSPGRIDREIEEGGIVEMERVKIKGKVKDAVFQALQARMERWKVLG